MKSRTVQLGCFDDEEAWALFEKKAGSLENSHDDIKKVAHKIVKKCNGLPISIATLGSALKGKTNPHTWESTYRRLEDHRLPDIEDINEENAYKSLEVSFDYLNDMGTKMCFLLCSLFPEDHEIYVEDLAIYAWGLELYSGARSVEQVRSEVHAAVDIMKSSCLLIDSGERHVKMHDLVRDVALWIASGRGELSFSIKSEVVETWPDESFEPYAAISFKTSRKDELPKGLICPNLKILLLLHDGDGDCSVHDRLISPEAFRSQTNLRALHLECCKFLNVSLLRKLTNLRTLHLERCKLPDISLLGKLSELQVLSFIGSDIKVLPEGIGKLNKLKLLDLSNCQSLQRIPYGLIPRLSKLEELYLGGCTSINWATGKTTLKSKRASLSELNSLPKLTVLSLVVTPRHVRNKFLFPKLDWYDVIILLDESGSTIPFYKRKDFQICPIKRALKVDASVIGACKELFVDVESLHLINLEGSEDLVSSLGLEFDQRGLSRLTSLLLNSCKDMKCLFDATMEHVPTTTFPNLVELKLENMLGLKELCSGHQPEWFLSKLKTLRLYSCKEMIGAIPMLQNLETLEVKDCDKIEVLLQTAEMGSVQQASSHPSLKGLKLVIIDNCSKLKYLFPATVADSLGHLETLKICNCKGLEEIIKGAEQQVLSHPSLKGLKFVEVDMCNKLRYLFPAVVANSLGQLETLKICNCEELEEIIKGTEVSSVSLQSLREVYIDGCDKLTSLSSLSHGHLLENLRKLHISDCSRLKYTFPTSMAEGLPQLNEIYLEKLPELKGTNGNEIVLLLPSLQILGVKFCRQLTPLIISAKIQEFQFGRFSKTNQVGDLKKMVPAELRGKSANMEYVTITTNFEDCLFDAATFNLSSINKLTLCELYDLRVVWKGPIQVLNFQNLTDLQVVQCPKLRYIFSSTTMVRNLPQLSFLRIFLCDGLEQIFEKDETSSQHYQPLCFPNLTCIDIHSCSNLKSLFPVSVARNLPKLMLLQMGHVSKLEEVFENGDDEATMSQDNEKVIHLPQLETLELDNLDNLKSFSPMGYHFVLPRLRDLAVKRCPRITTRFSIDSDQWGHAIETITSIDKNIAKASPTTHQTTWPIRSEIRYRRKE